MNFALDMFGDRWSLLIFRGKHHFGEFALSGEKISTNILASRLAKLETEGINLLPVILEMIIWSATHDPQPNAKLNIIHGAPPDLLGRAQTDRAALIRDLIANMA